MPLVIAETVKEKKHPLARIAGQKWVRPVPGNVAGKHRWRQAGFCYFALWLQCTEFAVTVLAPLCYAGFNTQDRHIVILERHRSLDAEP